ncbi:MAG: carboxymuconolactone decarboxylase family protein, partial [Cellvibrionales bacterium]
MAHLQPLERGVIEDDELQSMLERYLLIRKFIPNSVLTMARRPAIAKAFAALNQAILYEGTVPEETKMLVALISSQASGCRYCQSHMANLSNLYGSSDEKIAQLWEFETSELFTDAERAALRVAWKAGQLPNSSDVTDFDALKCHWDEGQIVEIVAAIGLFG